MQISIPAQNRRILVIDDNRSIHEAFFKVLAAKTEDEELEQVEAALFERPIESSVVHPFELSSAYQGEEGIELVRQAAQNHRPFAMAFVDIRMPPGLDGIQTTRLLWEEDPALHVVICTAYSDYSFAQICKSLGITDRLLILKKPFDVIEVMQIACMLTEKWRLAHADT